jgi:hypothetical protein
MNVGCAEGDVSHNDSQVRLVSFSSQLRIPHDIVTDLLSQCMSLLVHLTLELEMVSLLSGVPWLS